MLKHATTFLLVVLALVGTTTGKAAGLDTEGERILEVQLEDGTPLNNALVIYPSANDWFFPLGEISDSLGLAIKVSTALSRAGGFIVQEGRTFDLDVQQCAVYYGGRTESYPCNKVQIYQDEIYIEQRLLQKWFPIRLTLNLYRSQITVQPLEPLPIQLRRERERLAERTKGLRLDYDSGFPTEPLPTHAFTLPFIDEQISLSHSSAEGSRPLTFYNTMQAGAEVLGLETSALLAHDDRQIVTSRLNFSKRDAGGGLFGPLNAREISAFDVVAPLVPLISNGAMGRGFSISSFPLNQPFTFDKHDFEGPLPNGWEVILYRNEVLIDRQTSNVTGTYFFRNVALFYGLNRFRLTFFGPYGQRHDEYHTLNVSPDLLKPDTGYYRVSYLQQDKAHQTATAQYTRNLSRNVTVNTTLFNETGERAYGTVGFSGMNERFLFSTVCAFGTNGGKACEWSNQFGLEWLTVGAKYTRLFDFKSELFNAGTGPIQTGQAEVSMSYLLPIEPNASTTLEGMRRSFRDAPDRTFVRHLIAFSAGRFYWNHRLTLDTAASMQLGGRWDVSYIPSLSRFNLGVEYELSQLTLVDLAVQANFAEKYLINALVSRRLTDNVTNLQLTASRYFDRFALGATLASADFKSVAVGLLLTVALVPDGTNGTVEILNRPITQFGAATVTVYKDLNHNHQLDPGEPTVSDIRITVNQRELERATNESGRVFLPYLTPHTPVDIAIALDSLKDPFLRAVKKGVRIIPRVGALAHIALPLEIVGEVDGAVEVEESGKRRGRRGVEMELTALDAKWSAKTKSDRDGYFIFEEVPAGRYRLRPTTGITDPPERTVVIPESGSFESGQNFLHTQ